MPTRARILPRRRGRRINSRLSSSVTVGTGAIRKKGFRQTAMISPSHFYDICSAISR